MSFSSLRKTEIVSKSNSGFIYLIDVNGIKSNRNAASIVVLAPNYWQKQLQHKLIKILIN